VDQYQIYEIKNSSVFIPEMYSKKGFFLSKLNFQFYMWVFIFSYSVCPISHCSVGLSSWYSITDQSVKFGMCVCSGILSWCETFS